MICITGDTHSNLKDLINRVKPDGSEWTTDDKLIVCGDFGFVFNIADESGKYKDDAKLDYMAEYLPQQILFVSGNHENFDRLYSYPVSGRTALRWSCQGNPKRKNLSAKAWRMLYNRGKFILHFRGSLQH